MNRTLDGRMFRVSVLVVAALTAPRIVAAADEPAALVDAPVLRASDGALDAFALPRTRGTADGPGPVTAAESLATTVRALLEKEVAAAGGSLEDADPARIQVIGPAAVADLVRTRCAELQSALDGRVVLDVTVVRLPAGADAEPSREALAALVRSGGAEVVFGEHLSLRRGETAHRDATDVRSFVAEYEAEVAQYASSLSPITQRLVTGRRLAVQARTLPTGRASVTVSLQVVVPVEPMRRVTCTAGAIDLPEARFTALSAPFVLAKGETGTAVVPDPTGDGSLLLRVTLADAAPPQAGTKRLLDLRAVAGERVAENRLIAPGRFTGPGDDLPGDDGRDERRDACLERLGPTTFERTEVAPGLYLVDAAAAEAVEREFGDSLRIGRLVRRTLRLPFVDLAKAPWWDGLSGRPSGDVPAGAGAAGTWLRLPVRGDTPAVWMSGTWRRAVASVSVEIAESAVAVFPDVGEHFAGETVLARWLPRGTSITLDHRTAALLDPAPLPGKTRIEISATPRTDDVPIDGLTTALSRSRIDVGAAAETTMRREGADAVISTWTME